MVEGNCAGSGVPSGGFGGWYGHCLSGGGQDVVDGSTSVHNKSGLDTPFAAPTLFWHLGGVGGSGIVSHLANQAGSHGSSAPSMTSAIGFVENRCKFARYDRKVRLCGLGRGACFEKNFLCCMLPSAGCLMRSFLAHECVTRTRALVMQNIVGRFARTQS